MVPEEVRRQSEKLARDQEYGLFKLYKAIAKHVSFAGKKNADYIAIEIRDGELGAEAIVEHSGEPLTREEVETFINITPTGTVTPLAGADEYHVTSSDGSHTIYGNQVDGETLVTERPARPWETGTRWELRGINTKNGYLNEISIPRLREKTLLNYGNETHQVTVHIDDDQ
jgi:hypothetical protein